MFNILYILAALLIFGVIVCTHELGHYLAARAVGIGVEEFSVGFGPKIFGWTRGGIAYSLRVIPLGGYCKFYGEDATDARPNAFNNQPVWKRFLTVFSGPFMNFVLAYVAVFIYLTCIGFWFPAPFVADVTPGMNAEAAGLRAGDVITAVNDEAIAFDEAGALTVQNIVKGADPQTPIRFTVARDGESAPVTFEIKPTETENGYQIGILMGAANYRYPFFSAFKGSWLMLQNITVSMLDAFKNLFTKGEGLDQTVGPVGLISIMTEEIQQGFDMVLNLIVVISLNLGIVNLLPLPALDGGRLVFLLVEAVRRKPIKPEYEGWVHAAGFLLLIGVVIIVTYRDIVKLITG